MGGWQPHPKFPHRTAPSLDEAEDVYCWSSPPSLLNQSAYFSSLASCPRGCRQERGESSREVYYVIRAVRALIVYGEEKNLQSLFL